ncbi:monocarboxylate transporter 2-like [Homarus americanus]|uniref:monocarboxylate transporter 2-like n=1 Tax=Homarus americanus TaxID=6706 RepID=UPI001C4745F3|nr:monocarboxylate transporter 2-like [Homarus americanus]XP_042218793.1 monocarboxylate transporter 2-like [Homarus americanus]XP_042218794.1 monocarboxylate transporter 2-like [Homarus americanus]XP_042218796.1 monocarboxylate transporter 2-like [Homarus americanus]XP_042218797.1 monocarboxylate transporter 2-like [Homarus americanus]
MGGKPSKKKLVPNRPPPKTPAMGPLPTRMVAKTKRNLVPPDGGWGWMVVLGACITVFFFPAVTMAFGVLFSEKLEIMGAGATAFTLIGNGLSTSWSFTALLTAPLLELFGYRTITITGGLMSFLTMVLCAYSTSIVSFALSYSIVGGASCVVSRSFPSSFSSST